MKAAVKVKNLTKSFGKEKGTTILLAAHNVMEMEWLCDTVCEMDAGQLEVVYEK